MENNRLLIIDGNSLIFRAFYGVRESLGYQTPDGVPTNAVYGFLTMIEKVINEQDFSHIMVALDSAKPTFRKIKYPKYKANRRELDPGLKPQFELIRELLTVMNIHWLELDGFEADDIIGTVAKKYRNQFSKIEVFTGDKDLLQLIKDNVEIKILDKGVQTKDYMRTKFEKEYEIKLEQFIDYKALIGDKGDNIPGVPGIGPKKAVKLLNNYEGLEGIYENINLIKGKDQENLINFKEQAFLSRELATIEENISYQFDFGEFLHVQPNLEKFADFCNRMNFRKRYQELLKQLENSTEYSNNESSYKFVPKLDKIISFIPIMLEPNYHKSLFLGIVGYDGENFKIFENDEFNEFVSLVEKEDKVLTWDLKATIVRLQWQKIELKINDFEDILIANYVSDANDGTYEIAKLAQKFGNNNLLDIRQMATKSQKLKVDKNIIFQNFAQFLDLITNQIGTELINQINETNARSIYEMEKKLIFVLARMELNGIKVDLDQLSAQRKELETKIAKIEKEVFELVGEEFNINSPKQLGMILFEKLNIVPLQKNKTGFSTNQKTLEQIKDYHPVVKLITEHRIINKLLKTYLNGISDAINPDDQKIHTVYLQAGSKTGRISSNYPNMQNLPIKEEQGRLIRKLFVPTNTDHLFIGMDYSQIELRVLAHITNAYELIDAFNNNQDIHTLTATKIFNKPIELITSLERRQAKTVNFGIIYGQSAFGLSNELNISRAQASDFIKTYYKVYPFIENYMNQVKDFARVQKYVTTVFNRRRYIPDISATSRTEREFAERIAINSPIQGTAADIMKMAMIALDQYCMQHTKVKMLLQVHDEIIFEVSEKDPQKIKKIASELQEILEKVGELNVNLKVEVGSGENLFDLK